MAWPSVEIEVEGESYRTSPPVVLGRSRRAGSQDVLAVKTLEGEELYVFKGVYARWGCVGNDTDCTSHRQLEIAVEGGAVVVKNVGSTPTYSQGRQINMVILSPGQWVELALPGVYTHDGRKARVVIRALGAEPPVQPATALCTAFCEAWQIISQLYSWAAGHQLEIPAKQVEDLEHTLSAFKGHLDALVTMMVKVNPDDVHRLATHRTSIELIQAQLRQGSLSSEVKTSIVFMYNDINYLRERLEQKLACRC